MHLNRKLSAAIIAAFLLLCFLFYTRDKRVNSQFYYKEKQFAFQRIISFIPFIFTPFFLIMGTLGTVIVDLLVSAFVKDRSKN